MCGITGYVSRRSLDDPALVASLRHRGPDASGGHHAVIAGRQVFLGHARLSIIDLSDAGTQPMFAAEGRIALVFNGEIYNFQSLRDEHLKGVALRSHTDTEVLLRLYEREGLACLQRLNGDFAIAILDQVKGKLYLVRDRAGVKPLYYHQNGDELLFGSEIKSLIAAGLKAELAREHLMKYFVFKYVPGTDTLFRGVQRVPPASWLEYDLASGKTSIHRYWDFAAGPAAPDSYREAQEMLYGLVEDATRLRLIADVPVGNFLSGGLDSSIIAHFIKGNTRITHYCASQSAADNQQEGTSSDASYARRLANDWQLDLRPVDIGSAQTNLEQIRTTVRYGDDLIADAAQIPSYLITRGAAGTSKVFLSGMGADELFLGYAGHLLALLWSYVDRLPLPPALLSRLGQIEQGRGSFKSFRRYLYRLGRYGSYPAWKYGIFSLVGDFETSAAVAPGSRDELADYLAGYFPEGCKPFDRFSRFEYENFLQKNLGYVDRMSMANSVEVRVPFLDHRIMEFAYALPRSWKLSNRGTAKRILKDAFRGSVPDYVMRRRKAGFGMPIRSTFSNRGAVNALLDVAYLAEVAAVDPAHVNRLVDRHVDGVEDNSSIIYALISLQEWHRIYLGP